MNDKPTPPHWRSRLVYAVAASIVIVAGLASREYAASLPGFVAAYAGDTLWGLMVFLGISALAPRCGVVNRVGLALVFAFAIELSQLYHAPWIDAIRDTRYGGLILGFGFLWTDLVCYSTGIIAGGLIEVSLRYYFGKAQNGLRNSSDTAHLE